jgi:hypothetical protein
MSRKCCNYYGHYAPGYLGSTDNCGSRCCNFPSFIILILILLQFGKGSQNGLSTNGGIDKGLLFIIALFYLSCCSPCGKRY